MCLKIVYKIFPLIFSPVFLSFFRRYLSKVTLRPPSQITSQVGDSTLFSHLNNSWQFQPGPTPQSVWLTFEVDFAFKSPIYRHVASIFFEEVVQRMMAAFEGRCKKLYGPSSLNEAMKQQRQRQQQEHEAPAVGSEN